HPPLMKKLAALSMLAADVWPHAAELDASPAEAQGELSALRLAWLQAAVAPTEQQWSFGHSLLYGLNDAALRRADAPATVLVSPALPRRRGDFLNDADAIFLRARATMLLLGLALGLLVYAWSRALFGPAGGVFSLALFCFDPNFIAHSGLVTTDVGSSLFFGA